jgi:hypothetical protein
MFTNVRELVETANELTDSGSTRYSLRLDQENRVRVALDRGRRARRARQPRHAVQQQPVNSSATDLALRQCAGTHGAQ